MKDVPKVLTYISGLLYVSQKNVDEFNMSNSFYVHKPPEN